MVVEKWLVGMREIYHSSLSAKNIVRLTNTIANIAKPTPIVIFADKLCPKFAKSTEIANGTSTRGAISSISSKVSENIIAKVKYAVRLKIARKTVRAISAIASIRIIVLFCTSKKQRDSYY